MSIKAQWNRVRADLRVFRFGATVAMPNPTPHEMRLGRLNNGPAATGLQQADGMRREDRKRNLA